MQRGCFVKSLMLQLAWFPDNANLSFKWYSTDGLLLFKVNLDNFFWLNFVSMMYNLFQQVIVVENWYLLLLNWFPIKPVFTMIFSLPPGLGFSRKMKNQWRSLYSLSWFYAALLSNRWCQYKLISSDSPLPTTECLQATLLVSSSWDGPVYSAATFPAIVWSQFRLDLKVRATTNKYKQSTSRRKRLQRICLPTSLMLQLTLAC